MNTRAKVYIAVLILVLSSIVYLEFTKEKQIDWYESYFEEHKIPYGTYILRQELSSLLDTEIKTITEPPFEFLQDSTREGTYFFVNDFIGFGEDELDELLTFADRGNDVFVSTNGIFADTLALESRRLVSTAITENFSVRFSNTSLNDKEYKFDRDFTKGFFAEIDTGKTVILGELIIRDGDGEIAQKGVNFVKIPFGKGNLYFHSFPEAFTNYNMVKDDNHQYVASVLSYLDASKPILWDSYYKNGKGITISPVYYLVSQKSLKWSYYILLMSILIFVIFRSKRTQRVIPVIKPLKNQTLAFTRTIANMYYEKSEHKNIAHHKINYFLEYIRYHYRISTLKIDELFYRNLANRSGNTIEDIKKLFEKIKEIKRKEKISKKELTDLNTAIEQFKKQ